MFTNSPVEFNTSTWNLINVESIKGLFEVVQFAPTSNLSGMKFSNKLLDATSFLRMAKGDFSTATDWNFSGVTDMSNAFYSARISNLDTTGWNTQNVTDFSNTFYGFECTDCNFEGVQITTKTIKTSSMFNGYKGPSEINLGASNMTEVVDSFEMFQFLNFSLMPNTAWISVGSKNKNISYMFSKVTNLELDTSSWNTSNVENFQNLFWKVDMDQVNTSGIVLTAKATNAIEMFTNTTNLTLNTNAPGKEWNTSSVVDMSYMVGNGRCKSISSCDFSRIIPSINTTNMNGTFAANTDGLDNSNFPPVDTTSWNTTKVKNFDSLFYSRNMAGSNLSGLTVTSEAETLIEMFINAQNLELNTTGWDISKVTDISHIFREADLTNVNLSGFNPGPVMENLNHAFYGISNGVINTQDWNLPASADVEFLFGENTNTEITLKDIDLASLTSSTTDLFWGPSNGSHIIIEGTTTDFSGDLTTGGFWPRIWCLDWSGTEFGGVTCQKVAYPGP